MDITKSISKLSSSRGATTAVILVGEVLVGLLVFHAGIAYGERHALSRMGQDTPPSFGFLVHSFIPEGHGAVGTITDMSTTTITIQTREGESEIVRIGPKTVVHGQLPGTRTSSLAVGRTIVVIGEPASDEPDSIIAKLIRLLPPLPSLTK